MTRYHFYYLAYIFSLFLVESAARKVVEQNFFFVPMLVLLACLVVVLKFSVARIVWLVFFAGFLLEIFSGQFFGSYLFALGLMASVMLFLTRRVAIREASVLNSFFLVILATLLFFFGIFLYSGLFSLLGFGNGRVWKNFLSSELLWTIAVNLAMFYPVKFFFTILSRQDEKSI